MRAPLAPIVAVLSTLLLGCLGPTAPPSPVSTPSPTAPATSSPTPAPSPSASEPAAVAEFVVAAFSLVTSPDLIVPGATVQVGADVRNTGTAAGTFDAVLLSGSTVLAQRSRVIEPGSMQRFVFDFIAPQPGELSLQLGEAQLAVEVLGPADVVVGAFTLAPSPGTLGEKVNVIVPVSNMGGLPGQARLVLTVNGQQLYEQVVHVQGHESTTAAFEFVAEEAGPNEVAVNDVTQDLLVWQITRPKNGAVYVNKLRGGEGRLKVENEGEDDALIVLTRTDRPSKRALAFYVRAGSSHTIRGIKDGTYLVYYATGQYWDAYTGTFTLADTRQRFEDEFEFTTTRTTATVWTITLDTSFGNAPSDDIGEDEFPSEDDE
jgi:hypothetical protein